MKYKAYRFDSLEEREYWVNQLGKDAFEHVPTKGERSGYLIQKGTSNWAGMWTSASREDFKNNTYCDHSSLEEVLIKKSSTFEEQVVIAKSYIGKKIEYLGHVYEIDEVRVVVSETESDIDHDIIPLLKEKPWVVCLVSKFGSMFDVMDMNIIDVPDTKTIKLTNDYNAVISKDDVVVGCQTIPKVKIEEILTIMKELQ